MVRFRGGGASAGASVLGLLSFVALLLGTAATAGLERIDAYRLDSITVAPCAKRALGFAPFEVALWWVSFGALFVGLIGALVALAMPRDQKGARPSRTILCILGAIAAVLLILSLTAHRQPFDFDDSALPMCGAAGEGSVP